MQRCVIVGSDRLQLVQLGSSLQQEALLVQRADQALKVHHLEHKENTLGTHQRLGIHVEGVISCFLNGI